MPLINWTTGMSVNVAEMDNQHKALIDIINQLHEAMRTGKGSLEIGAIVDQMVDYTRKHFSYEEQVLSSNQYPQFQRQKAEHDAFIQKAVEYKRDALQGKLALSVQVSQYLKEWWTRHIQVEDKQYGGYLNSRGIR